MKKQNLFYKINDKEIHCGSNQFEKFDLKGQGIIAKDEALLKHIEYTTFDDIKNTIDLAIGKMFYVIRKLEGIIRLGYSLLIIHGKRIEL